MDDMFEHVEQDETTSQPGVPIKAKIAYQDYLGLGPGRTIEMLYNKYCLAVEGTSLKPYASLQQLKHWRLVGKWDHQVLKDVGTLPLDQAAELDKLDLMRHEHELKVRQIEAWDEIQTAHREKMVAIGEKLLERAVEMLSAPLYQEEIQEDGMTIIRYPVKWGPGDAARYIDLGDKITRLAAEMDTQRARVTVDKAKAEKIAEKTGLSVEEIMRRAEELVREG